MEPFHPNDPVWKLLGNARKIEPQPNFVQNVVRQARQTPQSRRWWQAVGDWFEGHPAALPRLAVASIAVLLVIGVMNWPHDGRSPSSVATEDSHPPAPAAVSQPAPLGESPLVADVETQWENMDHIDALLAIEDTSALSDSEIMFLLY